MDLKTALQRDEFNGLSDADALAHGNQTVVISENDEYWSYSGVALQFGDAAAEGLLQALQGAGLVGAAQVYLVRGMQLNLPAVQDKLTALAVAVPDLADLCNGLKEIGITHGTRWQGFGVDQPTIEQIASARAENDADARKAAFITAVRRIVTNLETGAIDTVDSAKEAIAAE